MLLLNYKPVLDQPTGIGVYANAVLPALQNFEHVFIPGGGSGGGKERLKRFSWSQCQLPKLARERKADLIFTPAPEGYLGEQRVPQIVMVHDLRPLTHPERSMQSLYFRSWVPPLLRQCRHILTNSNFTASEIQRSIGISEEMISITPLGYNADHFFPLDEYPRLHHRPYLLHIGQAYPHKNLQRLILAFDAISNFNSDIDLVLLGKPHPTETTKLRQLILKLDLSHRVFFKSYVPYKDLPNWYRGAVAFVYPSLWEGFGLPIIESMACGCPVITSLGSGSEEVAGDSGILINPLSISELTESMKKCISSRQTNIIKKGIRHAENFSWTSTIRLTSNIIETALSF